VPDAVGRRLRGFSRVGCCGGGRGAAPTPTPTSRTTTVVVVLGIVLGTAAAIAPLLAGGSSTDVTSSTFGIAVVVFDFPVRGVGLVDAVVFVGRRLLVFPLLPRFGLEFSDDHGEVVDSYAVVSGRTPVNVL